MMNKAFSEKGRNAYCLFVKKFVMRLILDRVKKKGGEKNE